VLASVTVTVFAPAVCAGTVKVAAENEPSISVEVVPPSATADPPNVAVIVFEEVKPVPEMVTVEPTVPFEGFKVIEGVTVKLADPMLIPSVALTE